MIQSVLARADASMVREKPYPHLVLENALEPELYGALAAEYPPIDLFSQGKPYRSNRVMFVKAASILGGEAVSPLWCSFTAYHTSSAFYADVLRVFGKHVAAMYPELDIVRTGVRGIHEHEPGKILLDAQFGINTPVVGAPSSVRGVHIDNGDKLFNGLLYFRHPEDGTDGGDFVIYKRDGFGWKKAGRVPYAANTLVLFINCELAAHAVAERTEGPYPRRYMSFSGELGAPLFKVNKSAF